MARKKARGGKDQKSKKSLEPEVSQVPFAAVPPKQPKANAKAPPVSGQRDKSASAMRTPRTRKSEISTVTAVTGMILTLVLGLYIGSLLPGLFLEAKAPLSQEPPSAVPEPAAADNLDPRLRRSINELEARSALEPSSPPNWINLGNAYFDGHMPHKAIDAYEHALALAPNNPDVLTDLGIMYREIGRYEKAVECFRKAVAMDPGHQNALFNAGVVLDRDLKLKAEAAAMWEQLLSLNPQAQAPNGVPVSEMVRELRQQPNHPGETDQIMIPD